MSKMGEPSLIEIRNMIEEISENVTSIRAKLDSLDPNSQNDFSPDDGDHRWPGLNYIKNLDNTNTTADYYDEEEG